MCTKLEWSMGNSRNKQANLSVPVAGAGTNVPNVIYRMSNADTAQRGDTLQKVYRSDQPQSTPTSPCPKAKGMSRPNDDSCYTVTKCRCSREHTIGRANVSTYNKIHVTVSIEGILCEIEVNMGSALSLISRHTIKQLVPRIAKWQLNPRHVHIKDYQGNTIPIMDIGQFQVSFKDFSGSLKQVLVEGPHPSLLGLDWLVNHIRV